ELSMKRFIALLAISSLAFGAVACSSNDDTSSTPSPAAAVTTPPTTDGGIPAPEFTAPEVGASTTYQGKGFSIDHPKNWDVTEQGGDCTATLCVTAPAQDGLIPAIIAVSVFEGYDPENLQTAWNQVRQLALGSTGVDPKTVPNTQGDTTLAGLPAKTADYTLDWGLIPASATQTMTLDSKGTAYVVTFMSSADTWDDLQPTSDEAFSSFAL
ncbi:MAG: hypothetical protein MUP92_02820, partial [Actinobacteria bacterium]|nr:hypothetical protein [Actinomycetota bacterium]